MASTPIFVGSGKGYLRVGERAVLGLVGIFVIIRIVGGEVDTRETLEGGEEGGEHGGADPASDLSQILARDQAGAILVLSLESIGLTRFEEDDFFTASLVG
ncbi:hypothetical protein F3Y22_tig00111842pilonHSYRG00046 [Hibiscus syriacus]|uniref:Uncharacterized protein n=1 Tax=Hibiscus syriacus TaxID=106335 RepID=A0A6A2XAS2_HIBSY|nr:hypothetical protein F3Y22_tig00111842pilonHSYRG00046 [Hibiscus syriacus]